jgi:uncharacterized membrane protein
MNWAPILDAPWPIRLHLATVVPAFLLGSWLIFFSTKGARGHRTVGIIYLGLMSVTAVTTLFIHRLMPDSPFYGLSPLHLLVPLTLYAVIAALWGARTHNVGMHRRAMLNLYIGGMLIAGSLTFLPGRILHAVVMGH